MALEWLVIGGGVHGTYLSHVLANRRGVARDRIRVVDQERDPLAVFWRCAAATGMAHLRSAGVHHLDLEPMSLVRFHDRTRHRHGKLVAPYFRPQVSLFRAHCEYVIRTHGLDALRVTATVTGIRRVADGYRVETTEGPLHAQRVVLAVGPGDDLALPAWANGLRASHVFHSGFRPETLGEGRTVAVVGGGISAAQLALAAGARGAQAMIVARHPVREHRFDSDPGWLGPANMASFQRLDVAARREAIDHARHRGSVPSELRRAIGRAMRTGTLRWVEAEVQRMETRSDGRVSLALDRAPHELDASHVAFATGFARGRPGGRLLDRAVDELGLPCAGCGFPLVGPSLEWTPGLFVSGALAELELGPTARNIAGARAAGDRIARAA
jgi:hypothetical protein